MRTGPDSLEPSQAASRSVARSAADAARRRAWSAFASVAIGILFATWLSPWPLDGPPRALVPIGLWFAIASICAAVTLAGNRRCVQFAVLLGLGAIAAGWTQLRTVPTPADPVHAAVFHHEPTAAPPLVTVEGRVLDTYPARAISADSPERYLFRSPQPAIALRADRWLGDDEQIVSRATGRVIARGEAIEHLRIGDRVRITGMLTPVLPPSNPGQPDLRRHAAQNSRLGSIRIASPTGVRTAESTGPFDAARGWWIRTRHTLQARALNRFNSTNGQAGAFLTLVTLGQHHDNAAIDSRDVRDRFTEAGVAHLLAISGFHAAVLIGLAVWLVRLSGDRPIAEAAAVGLLALLLLVLVPANTPVVRAVAMTAAVLLSSAAGRRYDRLTVLGWIAIALLAWRPLELFSLGFQLSVGITALLIWLADTRHPWLSPTDAELWRETQHDKSLRNFITAAVTRLRTFAIICVLCWLVGLPIIAAHTGRVSLLAPLAAIVLTPAVSLTLALGYAAVLTSALSPALAGVLADLAGSASSATVWLIGLTEHAALANFEIPPPSAAWAIAAVGTAVAVIRAATLRSLPIGLAVAAVTIWTAVELAAGFAARTPSRLRIDALAVGDGSCLVVRSQGNTLLWDCGSLSPGLGQRMIPRALHSLGVTHIPAAVITHANLDHYGALPDVTADIAPDPGADIGAGIGLERVLVSAPALAAMRAADGGPHATFLAAMDDLGVQIEPLAAGDTFMLGAATARVLWPPLALPPGVGSANDHSLVVLIETPTRAGPRRALLTGDIQAAAMAHLLESPELLACDILELPHHGSHNAMAEVLVSTAGATAVLQSTGRSRLGHPGWDDAKAATYEAGGAWWITARDGACWAEIQPDGRVRTGAVRRDPVRTAE